MITTPRPTREVVPDPTREVVRRHLGWAGAWSGASGGGATPRTGTTGRASCPPRPTGGVTSCRPQWGPTRSEHVQNRPPAGPAPGRRCTHRSSQRFRWRRGSGGHRARWLDRFTVFPRTCLLAVSDSLTTWLSRTARAAHMPGRFCASVRRGVSGGARATEPVLLFARARLPAASQVVGWWLEGTTTVSGGRPQSGRRRPARPEQPR
jgi:hypothetical protein